MAKRRKSIPASVKLEVAMAALRKYLGVDRLEFDHRPALWEREWDEEAQDTIPPANDPNFIDLVSGEEHDRRTFGTKATSYGSDAHERAKEKRLTGQTPRSARAAKSHHGASQSVLMAIGISGEPAHSPSGRIVVAERPEMEAAWLDVRNVRWLHIPRAEAARLVRVHRRAGNKCYRRYGETHIEAGAHFAIRRRQRGELRNG